MDKIKKAQDLADQLLNEATIKQVGDDKGALKDKPESIQKSEKDRKDAVEMKESTQISAMVGNIATHLGEASLGAKIQRGIARNDKNYEEGNDMDPKAKANAKKRKEKTIKEADQVAIAQQKNTLFDKLEKVVKDSGKLKATITTEPTTEGEMIDNISKWMKSKA